MVPRAVLLAGAVRQTTVRQAVNRPRRVLPPRALAGRPRRNGVFRGIAGDTAVSAAPQSGVVTAPHLDGVFRAVGVERHSQAPGFWTDEADGLLFLFELHSFAELARYASGSRSAAGDDFWERVLRDWLRRFAVPSRPAWHPFPTSARILAWCSALSVAGWSDALRQVMVDSLAQQLRLVRRSVEHDIGGNHVLKNASALIVGGLCCDQPAALRRGWAVLAKAVHEQVLPDGCHQERSPSYARAVLEDLHDVVRVAKAAGTRPPRFLTEAIARMTHALRALAGPDGQLPLFNDAWQGPAIEPLDEPITDLADGGFVVLRSGRDQAALNVGQLCPPHLPPHAHAAALSFVLWLDGEPVVIDPGSGGYHPVDREWARATRSHSTVEVGGQDQCVFWGPFRASLLPNVRRVELDSTSDRTILAATHDGYRRLSNPVVHKRIFCWLPGDGLVVLDRLIGERVSGVSRLPLSEAGVGPATVRPISRVPYHRVEGRIAPLFGVRRPSLVLEQRVGSGVTGWSLTRSQAWVSVSGDVAHIRRTGVPPIAVPC